MNLGARSATADMLLFHHVDSELTAEHIDAIVRALADPGVIGGGFYRTFDERHPGLRWLEPLERIHSRAFGTIYGDQSVFIRRSVFDQLGGFASIPLMEDVEFSRRLRRAGKIVLLDPPMRSSPRRQIEQGAWRVTLRNLLFLIAFRCGVSPDPAASLVLRHEIVATVRGRRPYYSGSIGDGMTTAHVRADSDGVIRARLDSCVFKGAVKENGEWRTMPMCSMNERKWAQVYEERFRDAALSRQPQVFSAAEAGKLFGRSEQVGA